MTIDHLDPELNRAIWQRKPALRTLYHDYYRRMVAACRPGRTLEIGGGSGNLKAFMPQSVSTDVRPAPWLDAAADAQALPFSDGTFDNIVMLDVLHHIPSVRLFFAEAVRILRQQGRIVMIEPAVTPISRFVFTLFHPESVDRSARPLEVEATSTARIATNYPGNQAVPDLIFRRDRTLFEREFPNLCVLQCRRLSLFAYLLTGGFRRWSLIPASGISPLLALESFMMPILGPIMAFRLFIVIERRDL